MSARVATSGFTAARITPRRLADAVVSVALPFALCPLPFAPGFVRVGALYSLCASRQGFQMLVLVRG